MNKKLIVAALCLTTMTQTMAQKIHAHGDAWPLVQNNAEWTWTK